MRRVLPLLPALALVVVTCSGGGEDLGPAATLGTAPTTPTTAPRPVDPAVIPTDLAQIDETYIQAVVDALFAVDAEATKAFLESKDPFDERALNYLRAIYVGEELDQQVDIWFKTLAMGSDTLLPGALQNDVTRIVAVAEDCVFFEVQTDFSNTTTREVPPSTNYLGVTPKRDDDDPARSNPTAWMLFTNGFNLDGSEPENPCAGR